MVLSLYRWLSVGLQYILGVVSMRNLYQTLSVWQSHLEASIYLQRNCWSDWAEIWWINSLWDSYLALDVLNSFRAFADNPLIGLSPKCKLIKGLTMLDWYLAMLRWIANVSRSLIGRADSAHFQTNRWLDSYKLGGQPHYGTPKVWLTCRHTQPNSCNLLTCNWPSCFHTFIDGPQEFRI